MKKYVTYKDTIYINGDYYYENGCPVCNSKKCISTDGSCVLPAHANYYCPDCNMKFIVNFHSHEEYEQFITDVEERLNLISERQKLISEYGKKIDNMVDNVNKLFFYFLPSDILANFEDYIPNFSIENFFDAEKIKEEVLAEFGECNINSIFDIVELKDNENDSSKVNTKIRN